MIRYLQRNWPIVALITAVSIGAVAPLFLRLSAPGFYVEVLLGGLMSGVMYSLVALGFVLIFKASGVFNFAQGAMVLMAALTFVRLLEIMGSQSPGDAIFWLAMAITLGIMLLLAYGIERIVLRPLV